MAIAGLHCIDHHLGVRPSCLLQRATVLHLEGLKNSSKKEQKEIIYRIYLLLVA
jgi:hypothetical protein